MINYHNLPVDEMIGVLDDRLTREFNHIKKDSNILLEMNERCFRAKVTNKYIITIR